MKVILTLAPLFLIALATAVHRPEAHSVLIHGSGRNWHMLQGEARDGGGPPNVMFQLCWPADGSSGYRISLFDVNAYDPKRNVEIPLKLLASSARSDAIRFRSLEVHTNPSNDIWDANGQTHKVFPHALFVGQGIENGKPVTLIWDISHGPALKQIAKVFGGNATYLDGHIHGQMDKHGLLVEHARASWLPRKERPAWSKPHPRMKRLWTYHEDSDSFTPGPWLAA